LEARPGKSEIHPTTKAGTSRISRDVQRLLRNRHHFHQAEAIDDGTLIRPIVPVPGERVFLHLIERAIAPDVEWPGCLDGSSDPVVEQLVVGLIASGCEIWSTNVLSLRLACLAAAKARSYYSTAGIPGKHSAHPLSATRLLASGLAARRLILSNSVWVLATQGETAACSCCSLRASVDFRSITDYEERDKTKSVTGPTFRPGVQLRA
jgi:hypothetical protein